MKPYHKDVAFDITCCWTFSQRWCNCTYFWVLHYTHEFTKVFCSWHHFWGKYSGYKVLYAFLTLSKVQTTTTYFNFIALSRDFSVLKCLVFLCGICEAMLTYTFMYSYILLFVHLFFNRRLIVKMNLWIRYGLFVLKLGELFFYKGCFVEGGIEFLHPYLKYHHCFMRQDTRSHNRLAHVVQKLSLSSLLKTAIHCYLPALLGLEHFLWVPQRFGYKPWQSSSWVGILATVYATQEFLHIHKEI